MALQLSTDPSNQSHLHLFTRPRSGGPDADGLRTIETFVESPKFPVQPKEASHNRQGASMPHTVQWYQSALMGSPEPLMAHRKRPVQPERDRNDFAGTLTVDLMRAPSPGGPTLYCQTLPHDPIAAQKRNEARRTPQHGPKGLHTIAVGTRPLPNTHDVCVCVCVCV